ncbi:MAG TPA: hypothetical protein HA353_00715, partial [Candidatus Poseidonia sp.]|nr:hypothetical protein [Poseidonia sp.]
EEVILNIVELIPVFLALNLDKTDGKRKRRQSTHKEHQEILIGGVFIEGNQPMAIQMDANPMQSITTWESFIKNRSSWLNFWFGRTMVMVLGSGAAPSMTPPDRTGPAGAVLAVGRTGATFLLGAAIGITLVQEVSGLTFHPLEALFDWIFSQNWKRGKLAAKPMA